MGKLCHLDEKPLTRQPWFPSCPEVTVRLNGKAPLLSKCILLSSTSLSCNTDLYPARSALLQLALSLSPLPQSQGTKQEKRSLHKSGHGTHLKALLRCKAQLLYTGTGSVAPGLPVAILCFLTRCAVEHCCRSHVRASATCRGGQRTCGAGHSTWEAAAEW